MLTDFRSYERIDLEFDGRPVALSGPNGAGKTNILEAISLLGPGRGVRHARLDELPRIGGAGGWAVSARLQTGGDERALGVGSGDGEIDRRVCRIDGAAASGPSSFADCLRLVWLTPAQDRLFVEGAGERRRFLDRMAMALDPAIARVSADYETAMRQRQRLLEEKSRDDAWLCALEMQMAENGVALAAARRDMAGALVAAAVEDDDAAFPAADIALEGDIEAALAYQPAAEVEEDFAARLRLSRRVDADAGRALAGPHRSDLLVTHRAKGRPARLCSTGEQKALLIGLVLANARALSLKPGGAPLVLLLDEIAAHLDEARRAALFDLLDDLGFQCFMTGTDAALFDAWGSRAQSFEVKGGGVAELFLTSGIR
ncbi:MAG: DNA replication/repair protein RecF [Alphaproteobacteria bacterium RIFCSPHIGHO2_12_FULL_63_12]|nr:MAG: DNA replication/repair protein RecF [Alphaproteobacteria bacterium RIFCSPHIGHO2_12_FULL_63_12]